MVNHPSQLSRRTILQAAGVSGVSVFGAGKGTASKETQSRGDIRLDEGTTEIAGAAPDPHLNHPFTRVETDEFEWTYDPNTGDYQTNKYNVSMTVAGMYVKEDDNYENRQLYDLLAIVSGTRSEQLEIGGDWTTWPALESVGWTIGPSTDDYTVSPPEGQPGPRMGAWILPSKEEILDEFDIGEDQLDDLDAVATSLEAREDDFPVDLQPSTLAGIASLAASAAGSSIGGTALSVGAVALGIIQAFQVDDKDGATYNFSVPEGEPDGAPTEPISESETAIIYLQGLPADYSGDGEWASFPVTGHVDLHDDNPDPPQPEVTTDVSYISPIPWTVNGEVEYEGKPVSSYNTGSLVHIVEESGDDFDQDAYWDDDEGNTLCIVDSGGDGEPDTFEGLKIHGERAPVTLTMKDFYAFDRTVREWSPPDDLCPEIDPETIEFADPDETIEDHFVRNDVTIDFVPGYEGEAGWVIPVGDPSNTIVGTGQSYGTDVPVGTNEWVR